MLDQNLTEHFKLREFLVTSTGLPNNPDAIVRQRLIMLARYLERVRKACNDLPITITSGYRSRAVNNAVGGSKTSAHRLGWAADIKVKGRTPWQVAKTIRALGGFDQLIYEPSRNIVHVSIDPRMRGQVLMQEGGPGTAIVPGLPKWTGMAANDN